MSATRLLASLVLCLSLAGCAPRTQPPAATPASVAAPAPAPPPAPPPKKIKLAVLPAEKFLLPKVAAALNERLGKAQVPGVDET